MSAAADVPAHSPEVVKRLEAMSELQKKYTEEHNKYVEEKKALDFRYAAIYASLTKQRADIITGEVDPAAAASGPKGVEKFWLTAFGNNRRIAEFIEEYDEEALGYLKDVTTEYLEGGNGFKLTFHFAPNPFFENETLVKSVGIPNMLGGGPIGVEPSIESLTGCEITWKAGKDLTVETTKKTVKRKGKKTTVTKTEPRPSFFRFFESPDMEAEMEEPGDDEDEEDEGALQKHIALQQQIHADVTIATILRNKIVPRAVDWFTGEAVADDSDDEDDDYEDDEDEEDDEEDEDEEEEEPPKRKGGKAAAGKKGKGDDDDEESEDDAEVRAALAESFKKGVKVSAGGAGGKKDGDDKGDKKDGGAGGDKPQECKQQ